MVDQILCSWDAKRMLSGGSHSHQHEPAPSPNPIPKYAMRTSSGYLQVCCPRIQLDTCSQENKDFTLLLQPTCDCMLVLAAQSPCKLFLHANHMAFVSPSAHLHRPPDNSPSPCCTPSQTPRQPSLPILHTIAKPLNILLCHPGGEAVEAVSTAASKAAEEAATGSWLKQLESGSLPRITAPGLSQGWFGPWETEEEEAPDHDDAAGRSPFVFQLSLLF